MRALQPDHAGASRANRGHRAVLSEPVPNEFCLQYRARLNIVRGGGALAGPHRSAHHRDVLAAKSHGGAAGQLRINSALLHLENQNPGHAEHTHGLH